MSKSLEPTVRSEGSIWERIVHPTGVMSRETARQVLSLEFNEEERLRMHELAIRNQSGTLLPHEVEEMDNFCRVGATLSYLKSRARQVLKSRRRVSS